MPPLGGVLCERCPGPPSGRAGLSLEALKLLKAYQRLDIEALASLRLAEQTEREVEASLRDFLRISLERDARSLAFLDEVRERHAQIAASLAPAADEPSFRDQRAVEMEGGAARSGAARTREVRQRRAPHACATPAADRSDDRGPSITGMFYQHLGPPRRGGGRGKGNEFSQGRHSGLTGDPDLPEPEQEPLEGGRRAAIRRAVTGTLAAVPRVIGLVWSASPPLTLGPRVGDGHRRHHARDHGLRLEAADRRRRPGDPGRQRGLGRRAAHVPIGAR